MSDLGPSTEKIVAVNGQPLRILGSAVLRIRIAGTDRERKVLITDDVSQNCFLGIDFLKQNGCIVDWYASFWWWHDAFTLLDAGAERLSRSSGE